MSSIKLASGKRLFIAGEQDVWATVRSPTAQAIQLIGFHWFAGDYDANPLQQLDHVKNRAKTQAPMLSRCLSVCLDVLIAEIAKISTLQEIGNIYLGKMGVMFSDRCNIFEPCQPDLL